MAVLRCYRRPGLTPGRLRDKQQLIRRSFPALVHIDSEYCFNVGISGQLTESERDVLFWMLENNFECNVKQDESFLRNAYADCAGKCNLLIEVGPRLNFSTAFSTNAVAICRASALLQKVHRIERSIVYFLKFQAEVSADVESSIVSLLHDRMTEQRYLSPLTSFLLPSNPKQWIEVDILNRGVEALVEVDKELGLAFDRQDMIYYTSLFRDVLKRNPTSVELFDMAQSNSEHSRHWFFRGEITIDGKKVERSLIQMVQDTQQYSNDNNVIKFEDNSSAIKGFENLSCLIPTNSSEASLMTLNRGINRHIIFTAETHNFPTGVAPFQGATTGTGGRIRDVQAAGRGAHVVAGTAGYCFGNLLLPDYELPWESSSEFYPSNFASPREICIEASNGASDYGNKFGEPVLAGFARSFGLRLPDGERREWIKPIMFSGGLGTIDSHLVQKARPEAGMIVTKVGGPVYRIGVGGGAASSVEIQGESELDFGAVQRGDPEMEQKLNRVIRACIESSRNPILSIHDQGAGGNGNVLKELVDPQGALIYTKNFSLADPTISTLELWGAEYQESNAILIQAEDREVIKKISAREKCPVDFVGVVTGDGSVRLIEEADGELKQREYDDEGKNPLAVNLKLEHVLGSMPAKKFEFSRRLPILKPLSLPADITLKHALDRVLRLPAVASKRYLTNKVDRSVTGLVAQQQCVGPLHTPLADYAMIALSFFDFVGSATSIGEQPLKGLISAASNARMSVAEAVTNLMFACITDLRDVKCSGNWMWPAKLPGEGAALVETCEAMCGLMKELRIAIDGGKDSLSMAVKSKTDSGSSEVIKSPGTLVISAYAPVPDIRVKVTPELSSSDSKVIHIDLSGRKGRARIGASALAQVFSQVGDQAPDIDDSRHLQRGFVLVQRLIRDGICTAGHDVSDGGLITCLLEMAFCSNCGVDVSINIPEDEEPIPYLFAEECGVVIEVSDQRFAEAEALLQEAELRYQVVARSLATTDHIRVAVNGELLIEEKMSVLRDVWEETSFMLELRQANHECAREERKTLKTRKAPVWKLTFDPEAVCLRTLDRVDSHVSAFHSRPRVALVREEGINGDREMIASLYQAGFEVADVTITDILGQRALNLEAFRGLIFPGGFSFADVLGSARGWAASLRFNSKVSEQLEHFKNRGNTFSLGVCNGCQLMALLGWVGAKADGSQGTLLDTNKSERFESRFVNVKLEESPAIMLNGMAGSCFGVWIAHGEGRFVFRNEGVQKAILDQGLVALTYADDDGKGTTMYPLNPNGSDFGIAGLCSRDGRHLAMMPHPERCTQMWQWPYKPQSWKEIRTSPWCKMFVNAYEWCLRT